MNLFLQQDPIFNILKMGSCRDDRVTDDQSVSRCRSSTTCCASTNGRRSPPTRYSTEARTAGSTRLAVKAGRVPVALRFCKPGLLAMELRYSVCLKHADHSGGVDASQFKTGGVEQVTEFDFGSFLSSQSDEHGEVTADGGLVCSRCFQTLGHDSLDQKQASVVGHRVATGRENLAALIVIPIVNDALQNISVGSLRNRLKEVTGDNIAAIAQVRLLEVSSSALGRMREIEEDSLRIRVRAKDG